MSTNTSISDGANSTANVGTESELSLSRVKRKATNLRSHVWEHFTKIEEENQCQCNYCGSVFRCHPVNCGTSTLGRHLRERCKKYPLSVASNCASKQVQVSPLVGEGIEGETRTTMLSWKFDQQLSRKSLAYMVIVDELPFKFVEGQGFKYFCSVSQPRFQIPSRTTVARDCFEIYSEEMSKLKSFIKSNCRKVCLTTDTWTSLQRINYMCLTAHFIDNDWKLNKKILNFCPISSHKGEAIGKAIEKCLNIWGIEKVMTVTVDNASSNDVAIAYMKRRINNWEGSVLKGEFIHVRCVAQIMNLVVIDGLKLANESVARVRNAVRYVRQSPLRLQKFKSCVEEEKIQSKCLLCLDVPTRWNSTLAWWKVNSSRLPILSLMARDILAIPISTVASESAFSTGGRVLDAFRSSLSPKIVEALICAQDWIRISKDRLGIEEKVEEVEQLDEELASVKSVPLVVDIA